MNEPSQEQQVVINHIINGDNCVVDACAGSGKSTTILSSAVAMPTKSFLQMTYNSALRKDVIDKVDEYGLLNLEVHTYHSFAVKYFLPSAHTDTGIRHLLYNKMAPVKDIPCYNVIVLDEAQDMTLLYYHFIVHITKAMGTPFQLLILGDWMQGLYEFKGADTRFLTLAHEIWAGTAKLLTQTFHKCTLRMSYRVTRQMAEFVNSVMLGCDRLEACKDGPKVMYIRNSRSNIEKIVVFHIRRLLAEGADPSDIFVLGGSVSGPNSNIRKMENVLVESNIPTHVPMMETADKIDDRVIKGKVVFSTFHTVKGRQRKYVFIVGYDNSYFTFCARNMPTDKCPNTLYVGCTRATDCMFLLENDQYATDRPLDFLKKTHHEMKTECANYVDFKGTPQSIFYERNEDAEMRGIVVIPTHHVTPTKLIKFVPESVIEEISPILDKIFVRDEESVLADIDIPSIIKTANGHYEDVSDLNGIAIPSIFYDYIEQSWGKQETKIETINNLQEEKEITGAKFNTDSSCNIQKSQDSINTEKENEQKPCVLYSIIHSKIKEMRHNEHSYLKQIFDEMDPVCKTPSDYLHMANMYVSVQERLYFKLKQIGRQEYSWLTPEIIDICKARMEKTLCTYQESAESFTRVTDSKSATFDSRLQLPSIIEGLNLGQNLGQNKPEIEKTIIHYTMDKEHMLIDAAIQRIYGNDTIFRFSARIDLITETDVWELKCTSKLSFDHYLQVVIYAWLWRTIYGETELGNKSFKIFNIRTNEVMRLDATMDELNTIMTAVLRGKYGKLAVLEDSEFVENCLRISNPSPFL